MEADVHFLGHGFVACVFIKGDRLLQGVDKEETRVATLRMALEIPAESGIQFAVNVLRQFVQHIPAFHSFFFFRFFFHFLAARSSFTM